MVTAMARISFETDEASDPKSTSSLQDNVVRQGFQGLASGGLGLRGWGSENQLRGGRGIATGRVHRGHSKSHPELIFVHVFVCADERRHGHDQSLSGKEVSLLPLPLPPTNPLA